MEKTLTVYLYLLTRTDSVATDEYSACIVAGANEKNARQLANENCGTEGYAWTDSARTEAKNVGVASDDTSGILLWSKETN